MATETEALTTDVSKRRDGFPDTVWLRYEYDNQGEARLHFDVGTENRTGVYKLERVIEPD